MNNLLVLLLLYPVLANSQLSDPNYHVKQMGLDQGLLDDLCSLAIAPTDRSDKLHPIFQSFVLLDDLQADVRNMTDQELLAKAAELWNTTYAYCYCNLDEWSYGPLDVVAIKNKNEGWVLDLYTKTTANVNLIRLVSNQEIGRSDTKDGLLRLPLADLLYEEATLMKDVHPFSDEFVPYQQRMRAVLDTLKQHGAKHSWEMTSEEIEKNSK